jgi:hypothetical protein
MVFEQKSPTKYGFDYHLTFHDAAAAELSLPTGTSRAVGFTPMFLNDIPEGIKWVGTTRYVHGERMAIGEKMIEAFGSYHRVFWNCQHFARLYLKVITDGAGAFDEYHRGVTKSEKNSRAISPRRFFRIQERSTCPGGK